MNIIHIYPGVGLFLHERTWKCELIPTGGVSVPICERTDVFFWFSQIHNEMNETTKFRRLECNFIVNFWGTLTFANCKIESRQLYNRGTSWKHATLLLSYKE